MSGRPRIYFDHNATSPIRPEVVEEMQAIDESAWANSASVHTWGTEACYLVEKSRARILKALGLGDQWDVIFFPSATVASNVCIQGIVRALSGRGNIPEIATSIVEHLATREVFRYLESKKFADVTWMSVDGDGRPTLPPSDFSPQFLSLIAANNETGVITDAVSITSKAKFRNPSALVHIDSVQLLGRGRIETAGIDYVTLSSHKIGGPKGIACLLKLKSAPMPEPILFGGSHESGLNPGTQDAARCAGFARAVELAVHEQPATNQRVRKLIDRLRSGVFESGIKAVANTPESGALCNTLNVSFLDVDGRRLVSELDALGICVSSGSACSSGPSNVQTSHVISALTSDEDRIRGAIRFSLGPTNTKAEVEETLRVLRKAVQSSNVD